MRGALRHLFIATALVAAACSDNGSAPSGATGPGFTPLSPAPQFSLVPPPAQCPTVAQSQATIDALVPQLFGPGDGRRGQAQVYSNNIEQARRNGNTELEKHYVELLINFTLTTYFDGNL